jgi:DNA (cytosine-5)-methyltransferase 1
VNALCIFSNIGGHALGLAAAGIHTVAFCEIQPQRRAFLRAMFPGVPVHDDVRTFHPVPGSASCLIGGPPCQRTSVAGAIHGKRDGESLWSSMLRIAIELAPEWIVVEQPPGNEKWETQVRDGLAGADYHSSRVEFSAADLGAPHIRRRVFILANPCFERLALAWLAVPREIARFKGSAAAGNHWIAGPPRTLRVANGPSEWLDRNAAVEAIGDSNPPGMATVVGRAIRSVAHERS